jgi:Nucleolar pre-ribosomal-associated protein 1
MELYRKGNAFDRLLALHGSSLCSETHRRQIQELIHRAIELGGGLVLITRLGIENWFAIAQAKGEEDQGIFKELEEQLRGCVDSSDARNWKIPASSGMTIGVS